MKQAITLTMRVGEVQAGEQSRLTQTIALALSVMFTVAGFAQDMSKDSGMAKAAPAAPLKNLKGTVKAEGDKLTFVSDKD